MIAFKNSTNHLMILALTVAITPTRLRAEEPPKPEPHVALGGHCPVAYQTENKAVKGDPANAVPYQGWMYNCSTPDAKKAFEANPAKYAAQYGELCTTALGGIYGNRLPSDPAVFYVIDGKLYLFGSLRARNAFDKSPKDYIAKADKLYAIPSLGGYSLTAYQLEKKAAKGDPKYQRIYQGQVYQFESEEAAKAFDKEAGRFIPKYNGFCAESVSRGQRFPADQTLFSVVDGTTYLFFDAKAKAAFDADPKAMIAKADEDWKKSPGGKKESAAKPQP